MRSAPPTCSLGDLYAWEQRRQLRLRMIQRQAEDRELAEVTFTPVISERSQVRCAVCGAREGPCALRWLMMRVCARIVREV